jgi:hypothetical protein
MADPDNRVSRSHERHEEHEVFLGVIPEKNVLRVLRVFVIHKRVELIEMPV